MSAQAIPLQTVLQRADIWRGDRLAALDQDAVSSGHALLDAELPGGGWPRGALTELLGSTRGVGELSLLLPALRQCAEEAPIAVVAPPGMLHAPAWAAAFPLSRLLVVQARREDVAWSAELLLGCGGLGALLVWLPAALGNKTLRRLQLAAEASRSLAFLLRPATAARAASPAPLRLQLSGHRQGLQVDILKRRGPACTRPLLLAVERPVSLSRGRAAPGVAQARPPLLVLRA